MNRFKSTLLIVEDNEENRDILSNMLTKEYDILMAANGQEALEVLEHFYGIITVILLDIYASYEWL